MSEFINKIMSTETAIVLVVVIPILLSLLIPTIMQEIEWWRTQKEKEEEKGNSE